jgi:hypothetical protein
MRTTDRRIAMLAALFATAAVQAQEVHKCTVDGAVTYQAKPCASGDVVLPPAPTPSEQETRQAQAELQRQRRQAAAGWLYRPSSLPSMYTGPANDWSGAVVANPGLRSPLRTTSRATPLNNCEQLDRDIVEATDRRDQLRGPSELTSREELLKKAESDIARTRQLATAGNCRLSR